MNGFKRARCLFSMDTVSVIIPSYNRFQYLIKAIASVKRQTHPVEIIVVNDCSTEPEYTTYDFGDTQIIHLEKSSRELFGYASPGYVRTVGVKKSRGAYIAFLDDDDSWFPNKIELQLAAMKLHGCRMSCTDGLIGDGFYDSKKWYKIYMREHYYDTILAIFKSKNSTLLDNGFPSVWTLDFLKQHNCCIASSVLIERLLLEKINYMKFIRNSFEDYDCWLRALEHTNCAFVKEICIYYDLGLERPRNDGRES
jgi:glycosyltransferase involved in cell wall biosynthesis